MGKITTISLDDDAEKKLEKIVKFMDRSVSDSIRKMIMEYRLE